MIQQTEITEKNFQLSADTKQNYAEILTDKAIDFLTELHQKFNSTRLSLLEDRKQQQLLFDAGSLPTFPVETENIRESNWRAAVIPKDLLDRRVEITGPVDRKMVINALNSGAKTFMADFEDSTSPTWSNLMTGQQNLKDAVNKTISLEDTVKNKKYSLNENTAVLIVRPRGLHLQEKNILIDGEQASGSLVDFGLYAFHNHEELIKKGTAPYFYLPKLEHYLEARWWNDVFEFAQEYLGEQNGTFKATVLVETITASFQLDEIIFELRDHIVGLNCGRWDYIFSYIKKLRNNPAFIVPNRDQVSMTSPFMSAYSQLVIQRCHKRNIHAIGGMAAQIPIKNDEQANTLAFNKVIADKQLEVRNGHDGTWVAHPDLVPIAMKVFDTEMPTKNQIHIKRADLQITESDLLEVPKGTITEEGIRKNISISILYLASWLNGQGAAAIHHLMEDAATAEISRSQLWQWLQNEVTLDNNKKLTHNYYHKLAMEEFEKIKKLVGDDKHEKGKYNLAEQLLDVLVVNPNFIDFLTIPGYKYI
ncbi:malate synthase A [Flavobacterium degerlachei]|jgi:malate synthase|uniref:Malate synthase n=1 Tax=Flavobacterium degerlachei TaxID=229203 RepID=A0A1H3CWD9_9FLAO|nr:malate synthase A [Flavobacterium degerlachei]SDX58360.1 malate synthase [Flavobacterium degerlachei]